MHSLVLFNPYWGATTPGQSGPRSNGNEGVLHISQSSSITRASLSDCLVSYPGHSLRESYPSVEMQSMYSTALADWATGHSLGESYPSAEKQLVYFTALADWGHRTLIRGILLPQQRYNWCILQPQLTGPQDTHWGNLTPCAEMQSVYSTASPQLTGPVICRVITKNINSFKYQLHQNYLRYWQKQCTVL